MSKDEEIKYEKLLSLNNQIHQGEELLYQKKNQMYQKYNYFKTMQNSKMQANNYEPYLISEFNNKIDGKLDENLEVFKKLENQIEDLKELYEKEKRSLNKW